MKFIDFFTFISKKILNFASIKRYVILFNYPFKITLKIIVPLGINKKKI